VPNGVISWESDWNRDMAINSWITFLAPYACALFRVLGASSSFSFPLLRNLISAILSSGSEQEKLAEVGQIIPMPGKHVNACSLLGYVV